MNYDYQYFCVLQGGGYFITDLPTLIIPGSFFYTAYNGVEKKFYVAEYMLPDNQLGDYDIALYCQEVQNDINIEDIKHNITIEKRNKKLKDLGI